MPVRDSQGYAPMDIFIIAGQSNASGRGSLANVPSYPNRDRVRMWMQNGSGFAPASEPVDTDLGGAQFQILGDPSAAAGFGLAFGNKYAELRPASIVGLVVCAAGNTAIAAWARNLSTSTLYGAMIARAKAALSFAAAGSRIAGIIWYQGESDCTSTALKNAWPAAFAQLVADIRSDLNLQNLPVIMTVLGPAPSPGASYPAWSAFVAQQSAMQLPENIYRVTANDLTKQSSDNVHLITEAYVVLGERYAAQMNNFVLP